MLTIEIALRHAAGELATFQPRLRDAVARTLELHGVTSAELSVAMVGSEEMQRLNRESLGHDYPTDALSFLFARGEEGLSGEIILDYDTARRQAAEYGWPAESELLLYAVHATLHLVGYDDDTEADRAAMRQAERRILAEFGLEPPWDLKHESRSPKSETNPNIK